MLKLDNEKKVSKMASQVYDDRQNDLLNVFNLNLNKKKYFCSFVKTLTKLRPCNCRFRKHSNLLHFYKVVYSSCFANIEKAACNPPDIYLVELHTDIIGDNLISNKQQVCSYFSLMHAACRKTCQLKLLLIDI